MFRKVYRLLTVGLLIKDTETDLLMALIQVIMGILELPCKAWIENVLCYFDVSFLFAYGCTVLWLLAVWVQCGAWNSHSFRQAQCVLVLWRSGDVLPVALLNFASSARLPCLHTEDLQNTQCSLCSHLPHQHLATELLQIWFIAPVFTWSMFKESWWIILHVKIHQ